MSRPRSLRFFSFVLLSACQLASAREILYLANGFDLGAKSHTVRGELMVVVTETGTLELARSEIARIEVMPDPPPSVRSSPSAAVPGTPEEIVRQAASTQGNAPEFANFVESVALVESGMQFNATSRKGAVGLMQLMPYTAKELGVQPLDPEQNAKGGAQYLRELLERYNNDSVLALAAYNAGPGAVDRYHGVPPYPETRHYVRKVLREYKRRSSQTHPSKPSPPQ
jgi:hypothetical protein